MVFRRQLADVQEFWHGTYANLCRFERLISRIKKRVGFHTILFNAMDVSRALIS